MRKKGATKTVFHVVGATPSRKPRKCCRKTCERTVGHSHPSRDPLRAYFAPLGRNLWRKNHGQRFPRSVLQATEGCNSAQTDEGWLNRQQRPLSSATELDKTTISSQHAAHTCDEGQGLVQRQPVSTEAVTLERTGTAPDPLATSAGHRTGSSQSGQWAQSEAAPPPNPLGAFWGFGAETRVRKRRVRSKKSFSLPGVLQPAFCGLTP